MVSYERHVSKLQEMSKDSSVPVKSISILMDLTFETRNHLIKKEDVIGKAIAKGVDDCPFLKQSVHVSFILRWR